MSGRLIVDGNSLGFAAQASNKLTVGGMEVQAIFNFLRMLRAQMITRPNTTPIILWDGKSWRHDAFEGYKDGREKYEKQRIERESYRKQRPFISKALKLLGQTQVMAINMEADDLAGGIVYKLAPLNIPLVLITGDGDWLQLIRPNVIWFDPRRDKLVNHRNFEATTGFPDTKSFLEGKALIGDTGDNLKGVPGIGEKAAPLLLQEFGSVENFLATFDAKNIPDSLRRYRKKLIDFAAPDSEGREVFKRNIFLMDLAPDENRPKSEKLTITSPPPDRDGFVEFCEELAFHSILKDLDNWIAPFEIVNKSPVRKAA